MMYQACKRPGRYPSTQRAMLIKESALQRPRLIHTAMGGKRMAITPRKISPQDMVGGGVGVVDECVQGPP